MTHSFVTKAINGEDITIHVNDEPVRCPRCGSGEVNNPDAPITEWVFNIRAYRVDDFSECLVCKRAGIADCWFNSAGEFSK